MANSSIPYTGSRVSVHSFVSDLTGPGQVTVEQGVNPDWASMRLDDGHGMQFVLSGDRSTLRMLVAGVLRDLGPDGPDPQPPAAEEAA
jgi:hypothetical protein